MLSSVLSQIVSCSGRKDWETGAGRTALISLVNSAQTLLDVQALEFKKSKAVKVVKLYAGMYFATFTKAFSIDKVWISNSEGFSEVDMKSYTRGELRELFEKDGNLIVTHVGTVGIAVDGVCTGTGTTVEDDGLVEGDIVVLPNLGGGKWYLVESVTSNTVFKIQDMDESAYGDGVQTAQYFYGMQTGVTRGAPIYGALNIVRIAEGTEMPLPDVDTADLITGDCLYDGILLYPPADGNYTLRLEGVFASPVLVNDTDISYWTEYANGIVLVNKTLELHEGLYMRNDTGKNSYKIEVEGLLKDVRKVFYKQISDVHGNRIRLW